LSFRHLDPQARKVQQVLQAQLVQRVAQVLLVLRPPLPSALSHLVPLPLSRTAAPRRLQSLTLSSYLVQLAQLVQLAPLVPQDQPPRLRLATSHLAPQPQS
jgi:hypothetical protein